MTCTSSHGRVFSAPFQLLVALAAVALTGCGPDSRDGPAGEIAVALREIGDSGRSGTAALSADGNQTLVVIEAAGDPVSEVQAAHIHEGTCDGLSAESVFDLKGSSSGRWAATVDVRLDTLTSGTYAIAIHKSGENLAAPTTCGDIKP